MRRCTSTRRTRLRSPLRLKLSTSAGRQVRPGVSRSAARRHVLVGPVFAGDRRGVPEVRARDQARIEGSAVVSDRDVAVLVIPTFNALPQLPRCLDSLSWRHDEGLMVLVVDAGSTDGTREWVRRERSRCRPRARLSVDVVDGTGRPGVSLRGRSARRQPPGALERRLRVGPCGFEALSGVLDAAPATIVCSQVRDLANGLPTFTGGLKDREGRYFTRSLLPDGSAPPSGRVHWCGGQGVLFSAEVFTTVGGFDAGCVPSLRWRS